jgi:hypothetical protein
MRTLTINEDCLRGALLQWEMAARTSKTMGFEEARSLSATCVADAGAAYLWACLEGQDLLGEPKRLSFSERELEQAMHLFVVMGRSGVFAAEKPEPAEELAPEQVAERTVRRLWLLLQVAAENQNQTLQKD